MLYSTIKGYKYERRRFYLLKSPGTQDEWGKVEIVLLTSTSVILKYYISQTLNTLT